MSETTIAADATGAAPHAAGLRLVSPLSERLGFAPALTGIARTAAERERVHRLPHEEIATLKALGFGALRLPADAGGRGLSLTELFTVARRRGCGLECRACVPQSPVSRRDRARAQRSSVPCTGAGADPAA